MDTLGKRLREIRTHKNLTQLDFGKLLGVTKQAVANVESSHSNPSIAFLSKLIEIFDVNVNWLITGKGNMFNFTETDNNTDKSEFRSEVIKILKEEGLLK